jgi:pimeloyl-ACP methyl ester carboxylesterase
MRALIVLSLLLASVTSAWAKPVVVLIPGSGSSGEKLHLNGMAWLGAVIGDQYFGKYKADLKQMGIDAFVCPLMEDEDSRTIEERVSDCAGAILVDRGTCSARDVLLVGHSMGGLVARELAQDPRVAGCIHSVTTLSTPHRGTPFAEWAIETAAKPFDFYGWLIRALKFDPKNRHYLPQLKAIREGADPAIFHAQDLPDNPAVAYYSFTNSMDSIPNPILKVSQGIISKKMVEFGLDQTPYGVKNDGIVPEYSMEHGTILGHVESYHWTTACVDPVRTTAECKAQAEPLLSHLKAILP